MRVVSHPTDLPDSLLAGLADRDVSIWVCKGAADSLGVEELADALRLPWKHVFIEGNESALIQALERPESGALVRRRGFIHVVDSDPSRLDLPTRALPVYLLSGRVLDPNYFTQQLRQITMLEELRRSQVRQLVILGGEVEASPSVIDTLWATGFRTRLVIVSDNSSARQNLVEWFEKNGYGPTASIVSMGGKAFAKELVSLYNSSYFDEDLIVRQRDDSGIIRKINLTELDDPERPLLENYSLIRERDFSSVAAYDLPEEAFNAFFRGEFNDWRAYAAGLPWIREDKSWKALRRQLATLDSTGSTENRIQFIVSESGAGGTTLSRYLAFMAARAGYPTLIAKGLPFIADALPLVNFLTRAHQLSEDQRLTDSHQNAETDGRLYETPWLLVFDRIHWESRETELRRFLHEFKQAGRPVCVLVVTGPQNLLGFDESRFEPLAELCHILDDVEPLALGRHLNKFLRNYGKEKSEWQWRDFESTHSVRNMEGSVSFWITLAFWIQTQYDLSENLQAWVYKAFKEKADTLEIKQALLQIAALSAERLPMLESLIAQGNSPWPVSLLLDDRRSDLSPLGLARLTHEGKKYWALAHDILGKLLINAIFHDFNLRSSLGYADATDAIHLRFRILRELSSRTELGESENISYGEEFAKTIFKIDPNHGRATWNHIWREVLEALDSMPAALRNGSRVFRHHSAVSRRRIAWLDGPIYDISEADKVELLQRAISDINFALQSIDYSTSDEPDINLYNSLANAYFDLARIRAAQGALPEELADLRKRASEATRKAYEQNPSSPYVIETHVKNLIASSEEHKASAPALCVEALDIIYSSIQNDRNELRRHALANLADKVMTILMSSEVQIQFEGSPRTATDVLVGAWIALAVPPERHAPSSLEDLPTEHLETVLERLRNPVGINNSQIIQLRYRITVAAHPFDFEGQLKELDYLSETGYRISPQLRLEYALLKFQMKRAEEANQDFKSLRVLWRETDIFVEVPDRLRWLLEAGTRNRLAVSAVSAYDYTHKAMARVVEFGRFDVPYRPQEFSLHEHKSGRKFAAHVSFGHNGPFLRPVNARQ
ncbi:hypothetical protein [Pseudomonas qingdaonensis]|uniref:hypothetical protein n=1 Tax=Pseudomonas qingdaonensis TaxID=2056231 RepID=UPI002E181267|nr:hypothetical protein [Pseudomonas qingdaonensis]